MLHAQRREDSVAVDTGPLSPPPPGLLLVQRPGEALACAGGCGGCTEADFTAGQQALKTR